MRLGLADAQENVLDLSWLDSATPDFHLSGRRGQGTQVFGLRATGPGPGFV
jgi:hypothetical protein